ncbi:MAG: hypothetical protein Q9178_003888 [Gyalolechia marmorata]
MAKSNAKAKKTQPNNTANSTTSTSRSATTTLTDLTQDQNIRYRLCVLLHDLNNVRDAASEKRLSTTTNELYISEPYFSESEAVTIRTAIVSSESMNNIPSSPSPLPQNLTVEEAFHHCLANFLEKRRASGDARPCGPHDMFPIYGGIFGITKEEVNDERFVARLRRSRLGGPNGNSGNDTTATDPRKESSKPSKGKGKK